MLEKRDINSFTNRIILGDCLDVMREMPAKSVNLTFCSPPYEDARLYGELEYQLAGKDWVAWCVERYLQCIRVTNGLVAWVVQGRTKKYRWSATPALLIAALHEAGVNLREPCIFWRSGIPGSGGPDWLRRDWEWIVCASQPGKLPWSDNTAMGVPPKYKKGGDPTHRTVDGKRIRIAEGKGKGIKRGTNRGLNKNCEQEQVGSEVVEYQPYIPPKLANPGNVIDETDFDAPLLRCAGGHLGSALAHENEAPFPMTLAEWFIRSFCPPGGIVLDPFSGSGTTAATASQLDRRFIGIDARQSQVDLATKRLREEIGIEVA